LSGGSNAAILREDDAADGGENENERRAKLGQDGLPKRSLADLHLVGVS